MNITAKNPPRKFEVGFEIKRTIKDCAHIELDHDEQVTFKTESGSEYDVTRKDWGFYATPSLNGRLTDHNLNSVLVKNRNNRYFILLVESGKESIFENYLREEQLNIVTWLNSDDALKNINIS
jgi:hypothetical protein